MREKANTVGFKEPEKAEKALPELLESRRELIEAIKTTELYRGKGSFSQKDPLRDRMRILVANAEKHSKLYSSDVKSTVSNFISHMDQLRSIGESLNPKSGMYTGRRDRSPSGGTSNEAPIFSPEDHQKIIRFLTSEANLCAHELEKIELAMEASGKSYSHYVLYTAGMKGIENQVKTYNGQDPRMYLKMQYHKVEEKAYARAADEYLASAKNYAKAQYYDGAVKGSNHIVTLNEEIAIRAANALADEKNERIAELVDETVDNVRREVKSKIEIILQKIDTAKEREDVQMGGGMISGKNYRETNGISDADMKESKEVVDNSDHEIKVLEKNIKTLEGDVLKNMEAIHTLRDKIIVSATKSSPGTDKDSAKYKALMTQAAYYENSASQTMAQANHEINNHYVADAYNLNQDVEHLQSEDKSIRSSLLEFQKMKVAVVEFKDNLRGFSNSVAPMKTTRERAASMSVSKQQTGKTPLHTNPMVAGLLRRRQENCAKAEPSAQEKQESKKVTRSGPKM